MLCALRSLPAPHLLTQLRHRLGHGFGAQHLVASLHHLGLELVQRQVLARLGLHGHDLLLEVDVEIGRLGHLLHTGLNALGAEGADHTVDRQLDGRRAGLRRLGRGRLGWRLRVGRRGGQPPTGASQQGGQAQRTQQNDRRMEKLLCLHGKYFHLK